MLYSYVGSSPLQDTLDWLNALQLCGFKSPPSHAGLVECFTATWVQVPSKSRWIGWMIYSYVGSSPLQVMLDWLNALQLCGFKSPPSHAGLVECFTAMWVQVMLDWLNALQLRGFKSPPMLVDTWSISTWIVKARQPCSPLCFHNDRCHTGVTCSNRPPLYPDTGPF